MAIDSSSLAKQVAELIDEIEDDPDAPSEGSINRVVIIAEVVGAEQEGEQSFGFRVNSSATPHVAIGFLEVAKVMQMKVLGLA